MVYRIYVEKKSGLDNEAVSLLHEATGILQIKGLERVRILNRYDVENIEEELFNKCISTVFSEPQLDVVTTEVDAANAKIFAVEYCLRQLVSP